jgi:Undecaprenyl-phosphate glucose phosphotransferase
MSTEGYRLAVPSDVLGRPRSARPPTGLDELPAGAGAPTETVPTETVPTETVPTTTAPDEHQQEPIRPSPSRGRSVRVRTTRRLVSHVFSAIDTSYTAVATVLVLISAGDLSLAQLPLGLVGPFVLANLVLRRTLRSSGAYRFERTHRLLHQLGHVLLLVLVAGLVMEAAGLLVPGHDLHLGATALWMALTAAGLALLHTGWWLLIRRWHRQELLTQNVVLVGATRHAAEIVNDAIVQQNMKVLAIFDDRNMDRLPPRAIFSGVPFAGTTADLLDSDLLPHVDKIVVTVDPSAVVRVRQIMNRLEVLPNTVTMLVDQDDKNARAAALSYLADAPLAPLGRQVDPGTRAAGKRLQDIVVGGLMLICALPVLAAVALAVKLDSPGPVLFVQKRHGFQNEVIRVRKFRTMRHEAADARAERQVTAGDVRITRIGRFLRRSSLDELPQLWNVIRGDMAMVGPRPHAIGMKTGEVESAQLVAEYAHRHRIKPGVTGWAAINGSRGPLHSQADVKRRVALDVEYIERQTLWLDLKILALTAPRLLGDRSAIR